MTTSFVHSLLANPNYLKKISDFINRDCNRNSIPYGDPREDILNEVVAEFLKELLLTKDCVKLDEAAFLKIASRVTNRVVKRAARKRKRYDVASLDDSAPLSASSQETLGNCTWEAFVDACSRLSVERRDILVGEFCFKLFESGKLTPEQIVEIGNQTGTHPMRHIHLTKGEQKSANTHAKRRNRSRIELEAVWAPLILGAISFLRSLPIISAGFAILLVLLTATQHSWAGEESNRSHTPSNASISTQTVDGAYHGKSWDVANLKALPREGSQQIPLNSGASGVVICHHELNNIESTGGKRDGLHHELLLDQLRHKLSITVNDVKAADSRTWSIDPILQHHELGKGKALAIRGNTTDVPTSVQGSIRKFKIGSSPTSGSSRDFMISPVSHAFEISTRDQKIPEFHRAGVGFGMPTPWQSIDKRTRGIASHHEL